MLESRLRWVVLFLFAVAVSFAEDLRRFPKPTGYVSDLANVISASDKADLESFCAKVQQQLGAQFAIVTDSRRWTGSRLKISPTIFSASGALVRKRRTKGC